MRKRFGNWGAELSDTDFACALAAAGALWALQPPRGIDLKPGLLGSRLWLFRTPAGILPWRLTRLPPPLDARLLLEAWRSFREFAGQESFRIEVEADPAALPWIVEQLSRPEVGAAFVAFRAEVRGRRERPEEGSYSIKDDEPEKDPGTKTHYHISGDPDNGRDLTKPPRAYPREMEAMREPPPRFLQAQLQPGRRGWHQVNVRIGLPDREWTAVEKPFPVLPEPPEPEGHRLTVLFWEPRVSPAARIEHLWLPPKGNSEPVFFPFEVPDGVKEIAARITVLHYNRVLQTGVLRAILGGNEPWTFRLDSTPRTRLEGLSARTPFDAALVLNHDRDGTPRLTAASDGQAVVLALDAGAIEKLTRVLGTRISDIANDPARYKGLESPGSVELLRELAQRGAVLHDHLCRHTGLVRLADARRIHITSARAESFFPAELLYRFRPPSDTATLCPHALKALKAGDCTGECPADKRKTICPLGFWGLSKVIERHAHTPADHDRISRDFELRPEPVRERSLLPISGSALLAASGKVSAFRKNAVTRLLDKLKKRGAAVLATTWQEWERCIENQRPHLLVLLPHHDRDEEGDEFLEIGESERLEINQIWDEMVRWLPNGPNPVVLLMGCETNLTEISFENPVTRFRDHGAAVVVSTIATILGRHASPATETLVQLLDKMADGKHTFGDIMLRLRQKLVATSTPMALGLTSYGDADWILTKEG